MATLTQLDGFEHGVTSGGAAGSVWDAITGAPTIVTSPVRTGARALSCAAAGAAVMVRYTIAAGNRQNVSSIYFQFSALPGSGTPEFFSFTNGTTNAVIRVSTAGAATALITGGSVTAAHATTLAASVWYRLDTWLDSSAGTWTLKWSIDGVAGADATSVVAAADITQCRAGISTASTLTVFYDDWVISTTSADYPIGAHTVERLMPNADGTHVNSADFQNQAGTSLSGTTTAYQLVDDAPLDTAMTDYVQQVTSDALGVIECSFEDLPANSDTVLGARAYGVDRDSAGAGAGNAISQVVAAGGGQYAALRNAGDDPGTTPTVRKKMLGTGGLDRTLVNGLKVQMGLAGDVAPIPWFSSFMLEVAMSTAAVAAGIPDLTMAPLVHR